MRDGRVEHADNLAVKINQCIARNRISALTGAKNSGTMKLWALLKQTWNWGSEVVGKQNVQNIDLNQINDYFASIASDPSYSREMLKRQHSMLPIDQ